MCLWELADLINDNCIVDLYDADSCELIATYDGKDSIPEEYNEYTITDVFVDNNRLCIEVGE